MERFIITPQVFDAVSFEDFSRTIGAMKELGLDRLPFSDLCIQIKSSTLAALCEWGGAPCDFKIPNTIHRFFFKNNKYARQNSDIAGISLADFNNGPTEHYNRIGELLMVLLAAKNIRKEYIRDKRAVREKRSGCPKYFALTTILHLPYELSGTYSVLPTGARLPCRPHLRRGHIRNQWYASKEKHHPIWIAPVFVNADDPEELFEREHYEIRR